MHKHATMLLTGVSTLALTFGLTPSVQAKDKDAKITGQTITTTGCLTKEAKEKNEYMITGEDGKTWGLKSNSVKLADHLNHKVTVTGKVTKEGHKDEAGDLDVTNLTMVSQTCQ